MTPIYSSEGLSQQTWRKLSQQAINLVKPNTLVEWLPQSLPFNGSAVSLEQALIYLHRPPTDAPLDVLKQRQHPYQQRLAFEELLVITQACLNYAAKTCAQGAPPLLGDEQLSQTFLQTLGFELTGAQQRVVTEINNDLTQSKPMLRLVQGDVGSGKKP